MRRAVPDMICISPNNWAGLPTSKKHLMQIFSDSAPVLFVEPPLDVFSVAGRRRRWPKMRGLRRVGERLWVLPSIVPVTHSTTEWRRAFHHRRRSAVLRAARSIGLSSPVVWTFAPEHVEYAGTLDEALLIYYLTDEPTSLASDTELTSDLDRELTARADIVFGLSERLREARAGSGKAHRLRSAADRRHFCQVLAGDPGSSIDRFLSALERPAPVPRDLGTEKGPVVLFGGAAYGWFHAELLRAVAESRPGYRFVMVGPVGRSVRRARLPRNVVALGRRSYDLFPRYVAGAGATIIPIREGETFDNCDPIVIYEYLLCGKPVVATPFPSALEHGEHVRTATAAEDFAGLLDESVDEPHLGPAARRRVEYAFKNTWEDRADEALRIIRAEIERG
jgi:hypothetical protein